MLYSDLFRLSIRGFKGRSSRTFLTVLGLGVGFGSVLFLVGMGYGLQDLLLKEIATSESLLSLDVAPGKVETIVLDKDNIDKILAFEEVDKVSPKITLPAQMSINNLIANTTVYSVNTDYFDLGGIIPSIGKLFDNNTPEILVSSAVIKLFDLKEEEVIGSEVSFQVFLPREITQNIEYEEVLVEGEIEIVDLNEKFKIVGVIDNSDSSFVFLPLGFLSDLSINRYDELKVKVKSNEFLSPAREKIFDMGFLVSALSDTVDQINKIFSAIQVILGVFGFIALVVSAIGMFNTMTITLLERTNEVGIMKAIGASNKDIAFIFLSEAIVMGFLGGVIGVVVGIVVEWVFNFALNILARSLGGVFVDIFYNPPWFIFSIVIFSMAVGLLTGISPSRRAARLDALQALRYK
ncbi:ABC transporter permease [Patescibacteria group bacterium]|nr:ABC transporter permease [Patescibacteria group bacterium]